MNTEVKFIRLVTGEDLLSEVDETDTGYILTNPCKIVYLPSTKTGYMSISLMQWVFTKICSEQSFELKKRDVLISSYPDEVMVDRYYDSVKHFISSENNLNIDSSTSSVEDALEILRSIIENKKGTLH